MRVYTYQCEPASLGDYEKVRLQLRLAGDYRRNLVRLENAYRAAVRELFQQDEVVASIDLDIKNALASEKRDPVRIKDLSKQATAAKKAFAQQSDNKEAIAEINRKKVVLEKASRHLIVERGLFWGTYLLVEDAHQRARSSIPSLAFLDMPKGPWTSIGMQIQSTSPLTGAGVMEGDDTRIAMSPDAYPMGPRIGIYATRGTPGKEINKSGVVRPSKWRMFSIRTGSEGKGNRVPIWTRFHALTESPAWAPKAARPLPPDARILWAKVVIKDQVRQAVRDRDGGGIKMVMRERWEVQFTVDDEQVLYPLTGEGVVGIDIGWRRVNGGIRVGYACTKNGFSECVIPDKVLEMDGKADAIRSTRDSRMEVLKKAIAEARSEADAPEWFVRQTEHVSSWRRLGHFVGLAREMEKRSFGGWLGVALVNELTQKDRHLRSYEHGLRTRQRKVIDGRVRDWIRQVLAGHSILAIEDTINIAKMMGRKTADSESSRQAAVANIEVSPGRLRQFAIKMAANRGMQVIQVNPANTTRTCSQCRTIRDASTDLIVACHSCGFAEDQDMTASREIARRAISEPDQIAQKKEPKRIMTKRRRDAQEVEQAPPSTVSCSTS